MGFWVARTKKGSEQRMANAGGGDLVFLHGFEQGGLGLGRRAIDFVGEDDVGEDRAGHERHAPAVGGFLEDLGAGDVGGHQVGGELDALELEVKDLGDGFHEQGLGEAGSAGDQAMAAGEEGDEDLLDDVFLADDDLGEFGLDPGAAGQDVVHRFLVAGVSVDG